jgi:hypothetical protein
MPYYVIVNNASYIIECQEADRPADPWIKVNGATDGQRFISTDVLVIAKGYDLWLCNSLKENVDESVVKQNLVAVWKFMMWKLRNIHTGGTYLLSVWAGKALLKAVPILSS